MEDYVIMTDTPNYIIHVDILNSIILYLLEDLSLAKALVMLQLHLRIICDVP